MLHAGLIPFGVRPDGMTDGSKAEGSVTLGGVGSTMGDAVVDGPVEAEAA